MTTHSSVGLARKPVATDVLATTTRVAAVIFIAPRAVAIWKGARPSEEFPPVWWLWSDRAWRGVIRSFTSTYVAFISLTIAAPVSIIARNVEQPLAAVFAWIALTAMAFLIVAIVCSVTIVLFNRPRFLVAPRLRSDLGVIRLSRR